MNGNEIGSDYQTYGQEATEILKEIKEEAKEAVIELESQGKKSLWVSLAFLALFLFSRRK
jgi:phosphoribosyl-ATP pyrophosphohydrolase